MKRWMWIILLAAPLLAKTAKNETAERLDVSATVLTEVMSTPDKSIPIDLLEKAHCIAVIPGLKKGAFIVGAKYGKGFISCRNRANTGWSAPGAVRVEGGSFGLQIGGAETDVILLVMNDRGSKRLLSSKFTLGGEGEVAAGPVGRSTSAQTDAKMTAEILSWSRSRGVFAGLSLQGATLREDKQANTALYGSGLSNSQIVTTRRTPPASSSRLMSLLRKYSPREQ